MFQQRPMPPMNSRGFFPQQGQIPMGRQPFHGPYMGQGQVGPQMSARGGGLKGLLSRIMPGTQGAGAVNTQGIIQGASGASRATGALQGLTNPSNISGMLGNVQKVLGMAQQVTPMVQQYGPLVKNLPAMIKIYRELNKSDDDESPTDDATETNIEESTEDTSTSSKQKQKKRPSTNQPVTAASTKETKNINETKKRSSTPKGSKPKMYI